MKVYNNKKKKLYNSPAGDQLWNSGRQNWIFGCIGDQEGAISDPAMRNLRTVELVITCSILSIITFQFS